MSPRDKDFWTYNCVLWLLCAMNSTFLPDTHSWQLWHIKLSIRPIQEHGFPQPPMVLLLGRVIELCAPCRVSLHDQFRSPEDRMLNRLHVWPTLFAICFLFAQMLCRIAKNVQLVVTNRPDTFTRTPNDRPVNKIDFLQTTLIISLCD